MTVNGRTTYAINKDDQIKLELPAVINGSDNNINTRI